MSDFTNRSTRVRGRPPVVDGIDDRIINYELVGAHRDDQIREFIGEFDGREPFGSAVSRNTTEPRYPYDIDLISFRYRVEISKTAVHRLGVHHVGT